MDRPHGQVERIEDMTIGEAREALRWLQDRIQTVRPGSEDEWNIITYNGRVCAHIEYLENLR